MLSSHLKVSRSKTPSDQFTKLTDSTLPIFLDRPERSSHTSLISRWFDSVTRKTPTFGRFRKVVEVENFTTLTSLHMVSKMNQYPLLQRVLSVLTMLGFVAPLAAQNPPRLALADVKLLAPVEQQEVWAASESRSPARLYVLI